MEQLDGSAAHDVAGAAGEPPLIFRDHLLAERSQPAALDFAIVVSLFAAAASWTRGAQVATVPVHGDERSPSQSGPVTSANGDGLPAPAVPVSAGVAAPDTDSVEVNR